MVEGSRESDPRRSSGSLGFLHHGLGECSVAFLARGLGRLAVKTGRQRDGEVEVLSGLPARSRFVARGRSCSSTR